MVLKSIFHFLHLTSLSVDYIVNFVVEVSMDHGLTNVFQQLINNIELIIDLHPIHEQAEKTRFTFNKKDIFKIYNIISFIMN